MIPINHKPGGTFNDFLAYVLLVISCSVTLIIFLFANSQNVIANVQQNVSLFEFE